MKKEHTIKPHREFDRIIHTGARVKSAHFTVFGEKNANSVLRIGIAVGKANGKAFMRVRIKRQVRAIIASKKMDLTQPFNLIIVVRPSYHEGEFTQNELELHASLDRMKEILN